MASLPTTLKQRTVGQTPVEARNLFFELQFCSVSLGPVRPVHSKTSSPHPSEPASLHAPPATRAAQLLPKMEAEEDKTKQEPSEPAMVLKAPLWAPLGGGRWVGVDLPAFGGQGGGFGGRLGFGVG